MVRKTLVSGFVLLSAVVARGEVFSYEGDSLPLDGGWSPIVFFCDPGEWIEDGMLFHRMEFCEGYNPPVGQQVDYTRDLSEYLGTENFFAEWRVWTDGDRSEIPFVAPVAFVVFNGGSVDYHFTISNDLAKLNRDNFLPIIFVEVNPDTFHTYRLESYGSEQYIWYIDGEIVDSGKPEGDVLTHQPGVNIRAKARFVESTTIWDYIRYGDIAEDGSGDFDSADGVGLRDWRYFEECAGNSGIGVDAGPGCRWADMDWDGDVDLVDCAGFQGVFGGRCIYVSLLGKKEGASGTQLTRLTEAVLRIVRWIFGSPTSEEVGHTT